MLLQTFSVAGAAALADWEGGASSVAEEECVRATKI